MPAATLPEVDQGSRIEAKTPSRSSERWYQFGLLALTVNYIVFSHVWIGSLGPDLKGNLRQILAAGFVVFAIAIRWQKVKQLPVEPSRVGFMALLACTLLSVVGAFLNVFDLYMAANIALFGTFVWALFGPRRAKYFLPAMFLALFMGPDLPEEVRANICIPMQRLSTVLSGEFAKLFIPMHYDSHYFFVNGIEYNVAPECSGLSMWSCFLFAFAVWQSFKSYRPIAYGFAFCLDPILTLVLNMVRLGTTAVVAFAGSQQQAIAVHANLEFALVPIGLGLLFCLTSPFENAK